MFLSCDGFNLEAIFGRQSMMYSIYTCADMLRLTFNFDQKMSSDPTMFKMPQRAIMPV